jgi:superfamily II DNA or RNA helicase
LLAPQGNFTFLARIGGSVHPLAGQHRAADALFMPDNPRFFSSRQRAMLFASTNGFCAQCGEQLDAARFHADHVKPWSEGGLTDLSNGQPLCPKCSLDKGANMLLTHQVEFQTACRDLKATASIKTIIAHVICGGGKSPYGPITVRELIPTRGQRVAWYTPRKNLRLQAEEIFKADWLQSLIGDPGEIRQAINTADPVRDKIGYTATYSAITEAMALGKDNPHIKTFQRYQMIVILDEFAHIELGGATHRALQAMFRASPQPPTLILMGGHLTRYDEKRVAFLEYLPQDKLGRSFVNISDNVQQRYIRYTLGEATRDRQLIKINFELQDVASAKWDTEDLSDGTVYADELDSFEGAPKAKARKALMTAVATEFAEELLIKSVEFWRARKLANKRSKLAVVCARISHAQTALRVLQRMGIRAGIATTFDDDEAEKAILQFRGKRRPEFDVLVAVGKVYEGMDCPPADVLCCLTHIRSREWIEQMLHRVTRYDRYGLPWEQQFATIFAPKDEFFRGIMEEIRRDQAPFVDETIMAPPGSGNTPTSTVFRPLESSMGEGSAETFTDLPVEGQEYLDVDDAIRQSGMFGRMSTVEGKKFKDAFNQPKPQQAQQAQPQPQASPTPTPSQREAKLRKDITDEQKKGYDPNNPLTSQIIAERGKRYWQMFRKSLEDCTEAQLQAIWDARSTWM